MDTMNKNWMSVARVMSRDITPSGVPAHTGQWTLPLGCVGECLWLGAVGLERVLIVNFLRT